MSTKLQKFILFAPFALLLAVSACDSNADRTALSLSIKADQGSQQTSAAAQTQSNHVTLTEVKILVRELELESDLDGDGISDDSLDFETGPFVMNLNLDGSLNQVNVKDVPAGVYKEIEFELHKPEDNETPPDPDFKTGTSGDQRFSVIVRGSFNGQDFEYKSRVNAEQEIEFNPPLSIDEGQEVNATLVVDLSTWFVDSSGNPLDPTDENNRSTIDNNIQNSFDAFEDNDLDGDED